MDFEALGGLLDKLDALEEILECPVCYERLSEAMPQCTQGHHVCTKCQAQVSKCPLCQSKFNGPRSHLLEQIIKKIDEIKISLTEPDCGVNEKDTGTLEKEKEKFPCRLEGCEEKLTHRLMIRHIRQVHKDSLIEDDTAQISKFLKKWKIKYIPYHCWFNRAIHINSMGLFFIKIITNDKGRVYGHVEITNSSSNAQNFQYQLNIGNGENFISFKGTVLDSRISPRYENIDEKDFLCVNKVLLKNKFWCYYECDLSITRLPAKNKKKRNVKKNKQYYSKNQSKCLHSKHSGRIKWC